MMILSDVLFIVVTANIKNCLVVDILTTYIYVIELYVNYYVIDGIYVWFVVEAE